ncbi:MAG: efflux RND transporter permease subunit [Acidobacteria bacterium]|nr:efflux RND transporter permease subunit [Acidobacteriota bacterium]
MKTIAWFARNGVAANLLMAIVIVGGLMTIRSVKVEVFPEFDLDLVTVTVPYLGAAPEEVEESVCVRIEEAVEGLDGIKKVTSVASEGVGVVTIQMNLGADARRVVDDIKAQVDAISTFPEETEKPIITELTNRRKALKVAVAGDVDEKTLRRLAEQVRDDLVQIPEISLVELAVARPYEISIEVPEAQLRRYGLTFDQVAAAVRRSSLDLPGGSLRTTAGEILLRSKGQAYRGRDFEKLVLLTRGDGTRLLLGDVARVVDGFAETDQSARFDGKPATLVEVYRSGEQSALAISDAVRAYVAKSRLPAGVELTIWQDASDVLRSRLDLLLRNGRNGFILVFLTLAIFLRFRLAIWVSLGLVMAFLGAIWLMPLLGVSINLISLFAFILVLGIVVDDAIVVGENVYTEQHSSGDGLGGAIRGTREVSLPVVFAVLTSVAAFLPMLGVPGTTGKVMGVVPLIVIPCLLWSLVESLWILPHHLSHWRPRPQAAPHGRHYWRRFQGGFANGLQYFIHSIYKPTLAWALEWRYLTAAVALATLLLTTGLVGMGALRFIFFPEVESDFVSVALTMPPGTPAAVTAQAVAQLERAAYEMRAMIEERSGKSDLVRHVAAVVGEQPFLLSQQRNAGIAARRSVTANLGEVTLELAPSELRTVSSAEMAVLWNELAGGIPDAVEVNFTASLFAPGEDINVQFTGPRLDDLRAAADDLKVALAGYAGVSEIADSFREGKRELKLHIKPQGEILGLSQADLARQVRQAFYGEEAQRLMRGRDEVKVMVRYPEVERRSLGNLENLRIRTADGVQVPFSEVADVTSGRGFATIRRVDRRRAVNVTAAVDPAQATPADIIADLKSHVLPEIRAAYPGLDATFEGQQEEQRETLGGLKKGFVMALILIFALLAIPLRSYLQPLIIMSAIPFGLVGAIWGHLLIGLDLTILSMFGLVALAGVVVNDSLVMVDFINRHAGAGSDLQEAVRKAGVARFRPILLTSLTTFAGLSPLMMERSMQARFLIPMAVSLAFGVLFATFITLILVPAGYLILEDLKSLPRRILAPSRRQEIARP